MFKNYLKVALRNLWKNKSFSAINIIGLATGLTVCLLIVLYVVDELSYDKYNKNADRIYRLDADIYFNNTQATFAVAPDPLAPALVKDYPEVEQMAFVNVNVSCERQIRQRGSGGEQGVSSHVAGTPAGVRRVPVPTAARE